MKEKTRLIVLSVLLVVALGGMSLFVGIYKAREEIEHNQILKKKTFHAMTLTPSALAEESEQEETPSAPTLTPTVIPVEEEGADLEAPSIEFLGMTVFQTGEKFEKTEIGGLSAIAYDDERDVYYVLSDDRGRPDDARFYTVRIAADGSEVTFEDVTFLVDEKGKTVKAGTYDTEGLAFWNNILFISSEGDAGMLPSMDPGVSEFKFNGERTANFTIPEKFLPDGHGKIGIRDNKSFESLAISPDGTMLTTAVENALVQDGPAATYEDESFSRLIQFDVATMQPIAEYVYVTGVIPVDGGSSSGDNGLVELIALDNEGNYLALERSYISGYGNTIQLYRTNTTGATDVSGIEALWENGASADFVPMEKTLITKLSDLGIDPDNVEGMAWGPLLMDGRRVLVMVSDNNFNDSQETQFIVLAIALN